MLQKFGFWKLTNHRVQQLKLTNFLQSRSLSRRIVDSKLTIGWRELLTEGSSLGLEKKQQPQGMASNMKRPFFLSFVFSCFRAFTHSPPALTVHSRMHLRPQKPT